jgi:hypothetical protein
MHNNSLAGAPVGIKLRTRMLLILQYNHLGEDWLSGCGCRGSGGLKGVTAARLRCRAGFAASLWKS